MGCANLMQLPTRRERDAVLGAAIQAGIRHFDVARLYGLGRAERELGRLVRSRRDEITIATKFGLAPSRKAELIAPVQGPIRAILRKSEGVRGSVKERADAAIAPRVYDVPSARASLDRSLLELGLDSVDVLFVHEPRPVDDIDVDGLREFFGEVRAAGKIRAWGVSLDQHPGFDIAGRFGSGCVVQIRDTVLEPVARGQQHIAFGIMGGVMRAIDERTSSEAGRQAWEALVGLPLADRDAVGRLVLAERLDANADGAVLYASTRPERIARAGQVVDEVAPEVITGFRRFLAGPSA